MGSRTRSPFRLSLPKPAGYDHYAVVVSHWQRSAFFVVGNIKVTSSSQTTAPGPSFKGTIKNLNSFGVHAVNSVVTLYDKWAVVINARSDATSPASLAASATASYSSTFTDGYGGWNRGVVLIEATKN